jgi:hypothetical protein
MDRGSSHKIRQGMWLNLYGTDISTLVTASRILIDLERRDDINHARSAFIAVTRLRTYVISVYDVPALVLVFIGTATESKAVESLYPCSILFHDRKRHIADKDILTYGSKVPKALDSISIPVLRLSPCTADFRPLGQFIRQKAQHSRAARNQVLALCSERLQSRRGFR